MRQTDFHCSAGDTGLSFSLGCNVRVDTTLVGFDQNLVDWERGNMSFIFKGAGKNIKYIKKCLFPFLL